MAELDITLAGDTAIDLLLFGLPEDLPPERELPVDHMGVVVGGSAAITAHNLAALGARVGFVTPSCGRPLRRRLPPATRSRRRGSLAYRRLPGTHRRHRHAAT